MAEAYLRPTRGLAHLRRPDEGRGREGGAIRAVIVSLRKVLTMQGSVLGAILGKWRGRRVRTLRNRQLTVIVAIVVARASGLRDEPQDKPCVALVRPKQEAGS